MGDFLRWCRSEVDSGSMVGFAIVLFVFAPTALAVILVTILLVVSGNPLLAAVAFFGFPLAFIVAKYRSRK